MRTGKLVECYDVSKAFSGKLALDRVNLSVGRGKVIGLLGPNGSGKTTLIKLMNGLIRPYKRGYLYRRQEAGRLHQVHSQLSA